jgi:hypothetical protein
MISIQTSWATETFGFKITHLDGDPAVTELVLPGLRRNPRRAHLLVSTVLGKHIAVPPGVVIDAGHRLADRVRRTSVGRDEVDVLGMAETATSLGHCVADGLEAVTYLHTTRRAATPDRVYVKFQEGHSHATDHTIQPSTPGLFDSDRPLVIVDDEISTGTTAIAAIEAIHQRRPRQRYVVASLVDVRTVAHHAAGAAASAAVGVPIDFVSLATGRVSLPSGMTEAVGALAPPTLNLASARRGHRSRMHAPWPDGVPNGGRHGFLRTDKTQFDSAVDALAHRLADELERDRPVLLVGHEELMYLPLRVAEALAAASFETRFQTTTRSPAYVYDDENYPLRIGFTFNACEDGEASPRYMYNGWPGAQMVLVVDAAAATDRLNADRGVVDVLTAAGYDVLVVVVDGQDGDALAGRR